MSQPCITLSLSIAHELPLVLAISLAVCILALRSMAATLLRYFGSPLSITLPHNWLDPATIALAATPLGNPASPLHDAEPATPIRSPNGGRDRVRHPKAGCSLTAEVVETSRVCVYSSHFSDRSRAVAVHKSQLLSSAESQLLCTRSHSSIASRRSTLTRVHCPQDRQDADRA